MKNKIFFVTILFALAILFSNASFAQSCSTGSIPSHFEVDRLGQANYDFDLSVPPGTAGVQPSLSLHYNSMAPNGHFGVGWGLEGVSVITRCPATQLQEGYVGKVAYTQADRFCLDGQHLVLVEGTYGKDGAKYRTSPDGQTLIVSHTKIVQREEVYFKVYLKDGTVLEYGGNANSNDGRISAVNAYNGSRFSTREWALSRTIDRSGNFILYHYEESASPTGEYSLATIDYTGRCDFSYSSAGLPEECSTTSLPYNKIEFVRNFTSRADKEVHYIGGSITSLTGLVTSIRTYADNNLVRAYNLRYELPNYTKRSRLVGVAECTPNGICHPETALTWSDTVGATPKGNSIGEVPSSQGTGIRYNVTSNYFEPVFGVSTIPGISFSNTRTAATANTSIAIQAGLSVSFNFTKSYQDTLTSLLGDFNGDGKTDAIRMFQDQYKYGYVYLSDGTKLIPSGYWGSGFGGIDQDRVGDFDGDGKADIIQIACDTGSQRSDVWLSQGTTFGTPTTWMFCSGYKAENFILADVNGDAKTDLVAFAGPGSVGPPHVWLSLGNVFVDAGDWSGNFGSVDHMHFGDIDGDGMADIVAHFPEYNYFSIWRSTGSSFAFVETINYTQNKNSVAQVGDFNGDRLADIALFEFVVESNQTQVHTDIKTWVSTGVGFIRKPQFDYLDTRAIFFNSQTPNDFAARITDFNGDGRADILVFDKINTTNPAYLYVARATAFQKITWGSGTGLLKEDAVGDFDGDGRADVFQFSSGTTSMYAWLSNSIPYPDKLVSVRDGYGAIRKIAYKPISNDAIYTEDSVSLSTFEPLSRRIRGAWYVVSEEQSENGHDALYKQAYNYVGAKHNVSRGLLGFNRIERFDAKRKWIQKKTYNQNFPLTGTIKNDSLEVDKGSNTYVLAHNLNSVWTAVPDGNFNFASIQLSKSTELEKELNGVTKSSKITDFTYDAQNNVTYRKLTSFSRTEEVTSTYVNDVPAWNLGLLKTQKESSTSSVLGQTQTKLAALGLDTPHRLVLSSNTSWLDGSSQKSVNKAFTYDQFGNVLTTTTSGPDFATRSTQVFYDGRGQFPVNSIDELGNSTQFDYNNFYGTLDSIVDPNTLTSTFTYDDFGRLKRSTRPDTTFLEYNYCVVPAVSEIPIDYRFTIDVTEVGKPSHRTHYDKLGRVLREVTDGFDGTPKFIDTTYDASFRVATRSEPYFSGTASPIAKTKYQYDVLDRLSKVTYPNAATSSFTYTAPAIIAPNVLMSSISYGGTITEKKTGGRSHVVSVDDWIQPIQIQERKTSGNTLITSQTMLYDGLGGIQNTADHSGNITSVVHDDIGTRTALKDPDRGITTFTMNSIGEMVNQTDSNNKVTTFKYDLFGRMTERSDSDGVNKWIYDVLQKNTLSQIIGLNGYVAKFFYDINKRPSIQEETIEGVKYKTTFTYDGAGRLNSLTYPGVPTLQIGYGYNSRGYLERVYNKASNADFWVAESQNARGQLTKYHFGNGVSTSIGYFDNSGDVARIISTKPSTQVFQDLEYAYDQMGALLIRMDHQKDTMEPFQYDLLGRLTFVNHCVLSTAQCANSTSYVYDAIGNITKKTDVGTYTYLSAHPHAVQKVTLNGGSNVTYTYDTMGNMLNGGGRTFTWSAQNMPLSVNDNGINLQFKYSPSLDKTVMVDASNNRTIYSGSIYQVTRGTEVSTQRKFVFAGPLPVAVVTDIGSKSSTQYLHHDNLGSLVAVTDSNGNVASSNNFDVFGEPQQAVIAPGYRGFTEHEHLVTPHLINARARLYDSMLGRFISADPTVPTPDDTQSYNRYSYANNSPTNLVDLKGYEGSDPGFVYTDKNGASFTWVDGIGLVSSPVEVTASANTFNPNSSMLNLSAGMDKISAVTTMNGTPTYTDSQWYESTIELGGFIPAVQDGTLSPKVNINMDLKKPRMLNGTVLPDGPLYTSSPQTFVGSSEPETSFTIQRRKDYDRVERLRELAEQGSHSGRTPNTDALYKGYNPYYLDYYKKEQTLLKLQYEYHGSQSNKFLIWASVQFCYWTNVAGSIPNPLPYLPAGYAPVNQTTLGAPSWAPSTR